MAAELHETHYENFPVASFLLPQELRKPVAAIYAFARSADDFADEGDLAPDRRLALLAHYRSELDAIVRNRPTEHPVFLRLRPVISAYGLPLQLFHDLLDAFAQDVAKTRYTSFEELADYCRRSANPVGRLLLHLFRADKPENLEHSDAICTALQLINHWQDVGVDAAKPQARIYLPRDELTRHGVTEDDILRRAATADFRRLMAFQVDRARRLMLRGAPLGRALPGPHGYRLGLEIRAIIAGGLRILEKIEAVDYDVFAHRPVLGGFDWPRLLIKAL